MSESGSDIEVIQEVVKPTTSTSRRGSRRVLQIYSDEEDLELPDLDDVDYDINYRGRQSKKGRRSQSYSDNLNVPEVTLSDDEDKISVATEVIRDNDLDSLPSISSPSPVPAPQDDYSYDDGLGEVYPLPSSTTGSSKSQEVIDDFDNLCMESQFTLADVLAGTTKDYKKKQTKRKSKPKEPEAPKPTKSAFSCSPTFSSFAATSSGKPVVPEYTIDKESSPVSYQMNKSSKQKRSKPKPMEGSTLKATATSAVPSTSKASKFSSIASSAASTASSNQPNNDTNGVQKHKPPKDVMKAVVLQISENILSDAMLAKLIEKEVKFNIVESPAIQNSISFEHNVPFKMVGKDLQVREQIHKEIDENVIILFQVESQLELLQAEINRDEPSAEGYGSRCLTEWIQDILKSHPKTKLTLLISGLEPYLRKMQRATQKEYRDKVLKGGSGDAAKRKKKAPTKEVIRLSRYEVLNAFISMQLETHVDYRFYESTADLEMLLLQYTKSIAEAPYKKEKMKSTEFDWYAVADAVGGIPVEENGQGMRSLWLAQLQQFPKVGQESALAIARAYGSPKALYQAYRHISSVKEGKEMLMNVQVTMGVGPLAKTRRLGPEASKRIYRFFTSTDGERELDS